MQIKCAFTAELPTLGEGYGKLRILRSSARELRTVGTGAQGLCTLGIGAGGLCTLGTGAGGLCTLGTGAGGKGEVMFGEVVGRVSGVAGGRAREWVALSLSGRLLRCVVEWKEVSYRLMWVKVKIKRLSWVFISAYGPGSEKSEKEIEEFWN